MTTDSTPAKSRNNVRNKWLGIGAVVLTALLFFTNPDQTAHLKSITEAVDLRFPKAKPGNPYSGYDTRLTGIVQYHNYGLFSTTGFFNMTFSYGFLGRVQTTNSISYIAGVPPVQ